jgi:LacI family transcriptional regulator
MVTIKDVAKGANVRFNTVSVVLGERSAAGRVGKETRARIIEIAKEMRYTRNAVAASARHGRTTLIAFVGDDSHFKYASKVLGGVCEAANAGEPKSLLWIPERQRESNNTIFRGAGSLKFRMGRYLARDTA